LDASLLPSQSCHRATDQWQRLGLSLSCCSAACSNWTNACCIITTQVVTCDCHSARGTNHMTYDITKALLFMNKWHSQWIKIKHNFKVWYVTMHLTYSNEIWTWCSHIASVLVGAWSYMCPLARQQIHPAWSVPKVLVPNLVDSSISSCIYQQKGGATCMNKALGIELHLIKIVQHASKCMN
jgi:hypothetical protein